MSLVLSLILSYPLFGSYAYADNGTPGHFILDLEMGSSDFVVDPEYVVTDEGVGTDYQSEEEGISIYLSGGYQHKHWIYRGYFEMSSLPYVGDIFDGLIEPHRIFEAGATLGYEISLGNNFYLVPQVGVSRWTLEQDRYLVPEDESHREEHSVSGTDLVGKLDLVYKINDTVNIKYAYTAGNYEFGEKDAHRFGIGFAF